MNMNTKRVRFSDANQYGDTMFSQTYKQPIKKRIYVIVPIICFFFITFYLDAEIVSLRFKNLTKKDGLSSNSINSLMRDSSGFMWIGTTSGLNKYDGHNIKSYSYKYNKTKVLSNLTINAIAEDNKIIWIGTGINGLFYISKKAESLIHVPLLKKNSNIENITITSIDIDKNGILWISTWGWGLIKYNPISKQTTQYLNDPNKKNSLSDNFLNCVYSDQNDDIWIGTDSNGLDKFNSKKELFLNFVHNPDNLNSISDNDITVIIEDSQKNLLIGTQNGGLNVYKSKENKFIHLKYNANNPDSLNSNKIRSLCEDKNKNIWVGTFGRGLNQKEFSTNSKFNQYQSNYNDDINFKNCVVYTIIEDNLGNIWIGTRKNGIGIINSNSLDFKYMNTNITWNFFEDEGNNIWIGNESDGLRVYNNKLLNFEKIDLPKPFLNYDKEIYVDCIYVDDLRNIWLGISNIGLVRYNKIDNKFTPYYKTHNNKRLQFISCIIKDQVDNIWIGTGKHGICRYDKTQDAFIPYYIDKYNIKGTSSNQINLIYPDINNKNKLWIGSLFRGLESFDRKTGLFKQIKKTDIHFDGINTVNSIFISKSNPNVLWVGTRRNGLIRYNTLSKKFKQYSNSDGISSSTIYGILEDNNQLFWISTAKGISNFDPNTEIFVNYYMNDGLQDNKFNSGAYYKTKDGRLFFGGINGANVFYPNKIKKKSINPELVITGFKIFNSDVVLDDPINEKKEIIIPYSKNMFSFEFSVLDFLNPKKYNYRYMLEGFNKKWIETTSEKREATYTNISPGKYTFKVMRSSNNGLWDKKIKSIKIIIPPPFWLSLWFKILIAFLSVLISLLLLKKYINKLRKKYLKKNALLEFLMKKNITHREHEILNLIIEGKNNKEIEDILFISIKTIQNHKYNIYKKLNINNIGDLKSLIKEVSN